jgi:hypothetical protein
LASFEAPPRTNGERGPEETTGTVRPAAVAPPDEEARPGGAAGAPGAAGVARSSGDPPGPSRADRPPEAMAAVDLAPPAEAAFRFLAPPGSEPLVWPGVMLVAESSRDDDEPLGLPAAPANEERCDEEEPSRSLAQPSHCFESVDSIDGSLAESSNGRASSP